MYSVHASHEWQKVYVPFISDQDFKDGEAQVVFRLGYAPETIDIGGVTVENFGKQLALADLPVTKTTYKGSDPNASWRAAAAERIEKTRKAQLSVVVKDASGKPVPHVQVSAQLRRHAFGFGTCAPAKRLLEKGNEKYQQELVSLFNTVTLENNLKWAPLAKDWGPGFTIERAQAATDWLKITDSTRAGMCWCGPVGTIFQSSCVAWRKSRRNFARRRKNISRRLLAQ